MADTERQHQSSCFGFNPYFDAVDDSCTDEVESCYEHEAQEQVIVDETNDEEDELEAVLNQESDFETAANEMDHKDWNFKN
jgi:hypothetical protein